MVAQSSVSVHATAVAEDGNPMAHGCPAFKAGGCPFSKASLEDIADTATAKGCPAFEDGCAFKDAQSLAELEAMLAKM